ncbi:MAG: hypothetical protein RLP44_13515 [Aggregatilineales bacterium]
MSLSNNDENSISWKNQNYLKGTVLGLVAGVVGAYLYNRAAEEDADRNGGKPAPVQTGQLIALGLTALGLLRQITELGKPKKK